MWFWKKYLFNWITIIIVSLMILAGGLLFYILDGVGYSMDVIRQYWEPFTMWLDHYPVLGPSLFLLLFVVSVIFFFPASIMIMISGAAFGLVKGSIYSICAVIAGAIIPFCVSRYFYQDYVEELAGNQLKLVQKGIKEQDWKFVVMTRLTMFPPYNIQNYLYGLTRISLLSYILVSSLSMIPSVLLFAYAGHVMGLAVEKRPGLDHPLLLLLIGLGIAVGASMLPRFFRRVLGSVEEVDPEGEDPDRAKNRD